MEHRELYTSMQTENCMGMGETSRPVPGSRPGEKGNLGNQRQALQPGFLTDTLMPG
jgi:hypothetical protein